MSAAVELDGARIGYSGREVIHGIDLTLRAGETTVLLGRSGSGKTTLLRSIIGLVELHAGEIRVEGRPTRAWDPIALRRRTGYVLQEGGLFPHYTVARNVGLVPALEGWDRARIEARVAELLALVGLPVDDFGTRLPHQLSGGQRQRVGVARALAADPPLILCDEPFGALDPITRTELQVEFGAMARSLGKTIVFVTHDVREALTLGDRIVLLVDGEVAVDAPAAELQAATHPEARAFLASLGAGR